MMVINKTNQEPENGINNVALQQTSPYICFTHLLGSFSIYQVFIDRRVWTNHQYLNSKSKKERKMAFYVFFSTNTPFPLYFPSNLNFHSSYNSPSFHSIENISQLPSATALAPSADIKNQQELPTIAPEEPLRSSSDLSKNRRKREKNLDRELISAKKNSESNIINHFFTFFTAKDASSNLIRRAFLTLGRKGLDIEKGITLFYSIIRMINMRRGRKYINKAILWSYFSEENLKENIQKIQNIEEFSSKDLSLVFRKCLFNFIQEVSLTSILTSKRITQHSKQIHLSKRRKITKFIISANQHRI